MATVAMENGKWPKHTELFLTVSDETVLALVWQEESFSSTSQENQIAGKCSPYTQTLLLRAFKFMESQNCTNQSRWRVWSAQWREHLPSMQEAPVPFPALQMTKEPHPSEVRGGGIHVSQDPQHGSSSNSSTLLSGLWVWPLRRGEPPTLPHQSTDNTPRGLGTPHLLLCTPLRVWH